MEISLQDAAKLVAGEVVGDQSALIREIARIEDAGPGEITFVTGSHYLKYLSTTQATAIIVGRDVHHPTRNLIRVDDPYRAFLTLLEVFRPAAPIPAPGIHPTAVRGADCIIAPDAVIGALVHLEDGCRIGAQTRIMPQTYIGRGVTIGNGCLIHPRVVLMDGVRLGDRVIVQAGSVIGSDGFGYRKQDGRYCKIPHRGTVILEDDVEIGANCAIDRGTVGETRIEAGVKLDNLVHIAHNVRIGRDSVLAAQVGISGSTVIGRDVAVGGQAGLVEHLVIGDHSVIGAQAGVTKSFPNPGSAIWGYPAKSLREAKVLEVYLRKLPELFKRFQEWERGNRREGTVDDLK